MNGLGGQSAVVSRVNPSCLLEYSVGNISMLLSLSRDSICSKRFGLSGAPCALEE